MAPLPDQVYFFGTCLVDLLSPEAGLAGIQLLRRAGVEVVFPQGQSCCGQPAFNSGYRHEALSVARAQLDCFPEPIPLVVPSASCAGMIRNHWPELFTGEPDEPQARALAGRTWELCEFLAEILDWHPHDKGEPLQVAVHHSCASRRETRSWRHAQRLLGALSNVSVLEPAHAEECCGFGGTFAIKQPELSAAMAESKCVEIEATGARCLISQDCGCLMNLGGMLERRGTGIRVQHLAEFLLERTA